MYFTLSQRFLSSEFKKEVDFINGTNYFIFNVSVENISQLKMQREDANYLNLEEYKNILPFLLNITKGFTSQTEIPLNLTYQPEMEIKSFNDRKCIPEEIISLNITECILPVDELIEPSKSSKTKTVTVKLIIDYHSNNNKFADFDNNNYFVNSSISEILKKPTNTES